MVNTGGRRNAGPLTSKVNLLFHCTWFLQRIRRICYFLPKYWVKYIVCLREKQRWRIFYKSLSVLTQKSRDLDLFGFGHICAIE